MSSIKALSKKCLLIIMDGFGINEYSKLNAIKDAKTPNLDGLMRDYPNTLIEPGGELGWSSKGYFRQQRGWAYESWSRKTCAPRPSKN